MLRIDDQVEKAQSILNEVFTHADFADDKAKRFAGQVALIWRDAEADPDVRAALVEEMRDFKGGKDRPVAQLVNMIFANRALSGTQVQIKNQIISAAETLVDRMDKYLPREPDLDHMVTKIDEWGGGDSHNSLSNLHQNWMAERSSRAREAARKQLEIEKRQRAEQLEKAASEGNFPTVQAYLDDLEKQENMKLLRARLRGIERLFPSMIKEGVAVRTDVMDSRVETGAIYFGYQNNLYQIIAL
jgi:hypothetical protein